MHVQVLREPGRVRLSVHGEVDVMSVPDLRLALNDVLDHNSRNMLVAVDLSDVRFIDATGLGALVGAHRRAVRNGAQLELVSPPQAIRRLLALTRLDRVLSIVEAGQLQPVA